MHTDLSPHLHTPECNLLIKALKDCHQEYRFRRFLGACNAFDDKVVKCLREERKQRQADNYARAQKRREEQAKRTKSE